MQDRELTLDNCVKCSDCNAVCLVAKVYPAFPGPKALGPDMERFRREGVQSDSEWVEYCIGMSSLRYGLTARCERLRPDRQRQSGI
jgi:glycerol-3-phosphate dehydrogenase subunit C